MILGMSVPLFTAVHVAISLIGIFAGFVVFAGMISSKRLPAWTAIFLTATVLTSATGFLFHSASFGPPHVIGVISLVVLAVSIFALYSSHLARSWRWIYVATALFALYLNVFVGVVQAFQKVSFLHPLAPNGSEPPFAIAQALVLLLFIGFGVLATKRFHPEAGLQQSSAA